MLEPCRNGISVILSRQQIENEQYVEHKHLLISNEIHGMRDCSTWSIHSVVTVKHGIFLDIFIFQHFSWSYRLLPICYHLFDPFKEYASSILGNKKFRLKLNLMNNVHGQAVQILSCEFSQPSRYEATHCLYKANICLSANVIIFLQSKTAPP